MRSIKLREVMLPVVIVLVLVVGWRLDRARLTGRLAACRLEAMLADDRYHIEHERACDLARRLDETLDVLDVLDVEPPASGARGRGPAGRRPSRPGPAVGRRVRPGP